MKKAAYLLLFASILLLTSCSSKTTEVPEWTYSWNADSTLYTLRYSAVVDTSSRINTQEFVHKLDSVRQKIHITVCRNAMSSIEPEYFFSDTWRAYVVFHFSK